MNDDTVAYVAQSIVCRTKEVAEEYVARHGGYVIAGVDGAWLAQIPMDDDMAARAEAATWIEAGTLVTDPRGVLPPVWFPEE